MNDREREALRLGIESVTPAPALSRVHPGVVRGQRSDGTLDIDLGEGGPVSRMSGVEPVYGLPATFCRFKNDAQVYVAFKNGDPRRRIAVHYGSYPPKLVPDGPGVIPDPPVEEINIANANNNQGAARQGDGGSGGTILFVQAPVGPGGVPSTLTILYQPPNGGAPMPILAFPIPGPAIMIAMNPTFPDPSTAELPLSTIITEGSAIVKIGG